MLRAPNALTKEEGDDNNLRMTLPSSSNSAAAVLGYCQSEDRIMEEGDVNNRRHL